MATHADVDVLASKLHTSGPLSWVVADCPVVALYNNKMTEKLESLGQPLDRNGCDDILRLWIGSNQDTRELFVTLTLRIRTSPVRKKTRRQGRLMFLVVPAESLRLHTACIDYSSLGKLPSYLFDMPDDAESTSSPLLHVSLHLGPMTSHVIMPEYQCRPNVMPQAMLLLRKLKLLSEASSFHLYANQNAEIQTALQNVASMLAKGESVTTPSVTFKAFYPGGRSACKNLWADQGWLEDTDHNHQNESGAVGTRCEEIIKPVDLQPPPPYELDTVLPPGFNHSRQSEASYLPPTAAFASEQGTTDLPRASSFSLQLPAAGTLPATSPTNQLAGPNAGAQLSEGANSKSLPGPRPSTPEPSLSPNYSATFLSGFPSVSPLRKVNNILEDHRRAATRDGSCVFVQVAASTSDRLFSDNNASTRANTPSEADRVPDSMTRKRLPSYSSEAGVTSPAKRLATAKMTSPSRSPLLKALNTELSPTVADTISHHDGEMAHKSADNTIDIASSSPLSRWLTLAWEYCPTAHYLFIAELLRYGAAISSSQADEIAACHIDCTASLLTHCTVEKLAAEHNVNTATVQDCKISQDTKALLRWLYTLRPGADMQIFDSLLQVSVSEQQLLCALTDEEHANLLMSCRRLKANVVSKACTHFGQEILQKDKSTIVESMLREKSRCNI